MARRFPPDDRPFNPDEVATPGVMRAVIYLVAFAALIGFVCGVVWIIWQLLRLHVLP